MVDISNYGTFVKDIASRILEGSQSLKAKYTEEEAWALAFAIAEIHESSQKLSLIIIPKICQKNGDSATIDEVLEEMKDELRHIMYHIRASPMLKEDVIEVV